MRVQMCTGVYKTAATCQPPLLDITKLWQMGKSSFIEQDSGQMQLRTVCYTYLGLQCFESYCTVPLEFRVHSA